MPWISWVGRELLELKWEIRLREDYSQLKLNFRSQQIRLVADDYVGFPVLARRILNPPEITTALTLLERMGDEQTTQELIILSI